MNKYRRLFEPNQKIDIINISAGNTLKHEMMKSYLAIGLAQEKRHFMTEAKGIYNGKSFRCDLVDLSTGRIIEIADSESKESIEAKRNYYPLPLFVVKAKEIYFK